MLTSPDRKTVATTAVRFDQNTLFILLSDGREMSVPLDNISWLDWLCNATHEQRANWSIEPGGFAIYWEALDDGVELSHLLSLDVLS